MTTANGPRSARRWDLPYQGAVDGTAIRGTVIVQ